jgi:uncharacterized protein (TIGR02996 family)
LVLPESLERATIVLGRSPRATIVFDDPGISGRHVSLEWDGAFWRARDLGTEPGTRVNGVPLTYPRVLMRGDRLEFGSTRLRFVAEQPPDAPELVAAIATAPADEARLLVYADWLLERGDPLGERIVKALAGERLDHLPWLGPVWDPFLAGQVELEWYAGFARKATVRQVAISQPLDWRAVASNLCGLRVCTFLRELVIDLPQLGAGAATRVGPALDEAQAEVASFPTLPSTLERLSLGYVMTAGGGPPEFPLPALVARLPRLRGQPVFARARSARLKFLSIAEGVKVTGLSESTRALTDVTRLRRASRTALHFETPPGIPFMAEGNPCYFAQERGGWALTAGRLRGELRVNARVDARYQLLPGDLIEVQGALKARFEVA